MARTVGSINKNKRGLKSQLKREYGDDFDIIMMMGKNAKKLFDLIPEEPTEDDVSLICDTNNQLEKIAQYVEPKLKAIEISGDPENPLLVETHELTGTERAARVAAILNAARDRGAESASD